MSSSTSHFLPKLYELHINEFCPISLKTKWIWVVEIPKISSCVIPNVQNNIFQHALICLMAHLISPSLPSQHLEKYFKQISFPTTLSYQTSFPKPPSPKKN
jgi:hypothetical protein